MNKKFLVVFLLCLSSFVQAEKLTVALYAGANPPYTIIKGYEESGIFIDIFAELELLTEHTFELVHYPFARVMREFDEGRIDIEPGVNESWRQHAKVLGEYTVPYEVSTEVIVYKRANRISVKSPQDLFGKSVGIVRGYSYPDFDDAFERKDINRIDNLSEKLLLRQLLHDRVPLIFIGYRTILYYKKSNPEYKSLLIGDVVNLSEVKLRLHPSKAYLLPEFNQAINQMKANGTIESIYNKYR